MIVPGSFSAIVEADDDRVTVGGVSLSVIVNVTCCVPFSDAEPPDTDEMSITAVS